MYMFEHLKEIRVFGCCGWFFFSSNENEESWESYRKWNENV